MLVTKTTVDNKPKTIVGTQIDEFKQVLESMEMRFVSYNFIRTQSFMIFRPDTETVSFDINLYSSDTSAWEIIYRNPNTNDFDRYDTISDTDMVQRLSGGYQFFNFGVIFSPKVDDNNEPFLNDESECLLELIITVDGTQYTYEFTIKGYAVSENDELETKLDVFNLEVDRKIYEAFRNTIVKQDRLDYTILNRKRREMLLRQFDLNAQVGSYHTLLNAIDLMGYGDLLSIREIWANSANDITTTEITAEVVDFIDHRLAGFQKTPNLQLVYQINAPDGTVDDDGIPFYVSVLIDTELIIYKLNILREILEDRFLQDDVHIIDIIGEFTQPVGIQTKHWVSNLQQFEVEISGAKDNNSITCDSKELLVSNRLVIAEDDIYTEPIESNDKVAVVVDKSVKSEIDNTVLFTVQSDFGGDESTVYRYDILRGEYEIVLNYPDAFSTVAYNSQSNVLYFYSFSGTVLYTHNLTTGITTSSNIVPPITNNRLLYYNGFLWLCNGNLLYKMLPDGTGQTLVTTLTNLAVDDIAGGLSINPETGEFYLGYSQGIYKFLETDTVATLVVDPVNYPSPVDAIPNLIGSLTFTNGKLHVAIPQTDGSAVQYEYDITLDTFTLQELNMPFNSALIAMEVERSFTDEIITYNFDLVAGNDSGELWRYDQEAANWSQLTALFPVTKSIAFDYENGLVYGVEVTTNEIHTYNIITGEISQLGAFGYSSPYSEIRRMAIWGGYLFVLDNNTVYRMDLDDLTSPPLAYTTSSGTSTYIDGSIFISPSGKSLVGISGTNVYKYTLNHDAQTAEFYEYSDITQLDSGFEALSFKEWREVYHLTRSALYNADELYISNPSLISTTGGYGMPNNPYVSYGYWSKEVPDLGKGLVISNTNDGDIIVYDTRYKNNRILVNQWRGTKAGAFDSINQKYYVVDEQKVFAFNLKTQQEEVVLTLSDTFADGLENLCYNEGFLYTVLVGDVYRIDLILQTETNLGQLAGFPIDSTSGDLTIDNITENFYISDGISIWRFRLSELSEPILIGEILTGQTIEGLAWNGDGTIVVSVEEQTNGVFSLLIFDIDDSTFIPTDHVLLPVNLTDLAVYGLVGYETPNINFDYIRSFDVYACYGANTSIAAYNTLTNTWRLITASFGTNVSSIAFSESEELIYTHVTDHFESFDPVTGVYNNNVAPSGLSISTLSLGYYDGRLYMPLTNSINVYDTSDSFSLVTLSIGLNPDGVVIENSGDITIARDTGIGYYTSGSNGGKIFEIVFDFDSGTFDVTLLVDLTATAPSISGIAHLSTGISGRIYITRLQNLWYYDLDEQLTTLVSNSTPVGVNILDLTQAYTFPLQQDFTSSFANTDFLLLQDEVINGVYQPESDWDLVRYFHSIDCAIFKATLNYDSREYNRWYAEVYDVNDLENPVYQTDIRLISELNREFRLAIRTLGTFNVRIVLMDKQGGVTILECDEIEVINTAADFTCAVIDRENINPYTGENEHDLNSIFGFGSNPFENYTSLFSSFPVDSNEPHYLNIDSSDETHNINTLDQLDPIDTLYKVLFYMKKTPDSYQKDTHIGNFLQVPMIDIENSSMYDYGYVYPRWYFDVYADGVDGDREINISLSTLSGTINVPLSGQSDEDYVKAYVTALNESNDAMFKMFFWAYELVSLDGITSKPMIRATGRFKEYQTDWFTIDIDTMVANHSASVIADDYNSYGSMEGFTRIPFDFSAATGDLIINTIEESVSGLTLDRVDTEAYNETITFNDIDDAITKIKNALLQAGVRHTILETDTTNNEIHLFTKDNIKLSHPSIGTIAIKLIGLEGVVLRTVNVGQEIELGQVFYAYINERWKTENAFIKWTLTDTITGDVVTTQYSYVFRYMVFKRGAYTLELETIDKYGQSTRTKQGFVFTKPSNLTA